MYGTNLETEREFPVVQKTNYAGASAHTYTQTGPNRLPVVERFRSGTNSPPATTVHVPPRTRAVRVLTTTRGPRVAVLVDKLITIKRRTKSGVFVAKSFTVKKRIWKRVRVPTYRYVFRTSKEKLLSVPSRAVNRLHTRVTKFTFCEPVFRRTHPSSTKENPYSQFYSGNTSIPFNLLTGDAVGVSHEGFLIPQPIDFDEVSQRSIRSLHSKISDIPTNLAQVIAERQQTISLLSDSINRLVRAVTAFRRRDLATVASSLFPSSSKQLANDYLAYKFGVVPLISDIEGMLQNLHSFDLGNKTVSATAKSEPEVRTLYESTNSGLKFVVKESLSYTVKTAARVRFSSELNRAFQRLGLTNLGSLAWELLPWSFVADWILPIGSWITSLENLAQVDVESTWQTIAFRREVWCEVTSLLVADSNGYVWDFSHQLVWKFNQFDLTRNPGVSIDVNPFMLKNNIFNFNHLSLSLALLRQKF